MKKFHHNHKNKPYIHSKPEPFRKKKLNHKSKPRNTLNFMDIPRKEPSFLTPNGWTQEISPTFDPEILTEDTWIGPRIFQFSTLQNPFNENILPITQKVNFSKKYKNFYTTQHDQNKLKNIMSKNKINYREFDELERTHLMCACMYSHGDSNLAMVKILLKQGTVVNFTDKYNNSALYYALNYHGNIEIIKLLIKFTDKNLLNDVLSLWLTTKYSPNISIAKILLRAGASINNINKSCVFRVLDDLHHKNTLQIIKFLLSNGLNTDMTIRHYYFRSIIDDTSRYNLLHKAIEKYNINDSKENENIISLLLDYGCEYKSCLNHLTKYPFAHNIIQTIEHSKSYFSTITKDLQSCHQEIIYKPGNLRPKILEMSWNLHNKKINKNIKWNNINVCEYFGIIDKEKLSEIISETHKCLDHIYDTPKKSRKSKLQQKNKKSLKEISSMIIGKQGRLRQNIFSVPYRKKTYLLDRSCEPNYFSEGKTKLLMFLNNLKTTNYNIVYES
ncbi:ankyrin repeat protein [Cotonvirus japonicus]|uniref:Ankyrin repeat protein n=1 Tax=Cotonvirus japonicus TaxID=2811091 RepID=A0ABM7NR66_9VIRU|nr:ankyrin repeat protein [Cotonvirus japonicus]BCS82652.1 ankyrin repeat protein [Cotonvirus japonicus]